MAMSFEVSPDLSVLIRNNYSLLDVLSDVGGLAEVLFFLVSTFLTILNYNHMTSHLASQLFKVGHPDEPVKAVALRPTVCCNLKELALDMLPRRCVQRCFDKRTREMMMGWEETRKEQDFVRMLRSLRYLRKAIRLLIRDRDKRKELKRESDFKIIANAAFATTLSSAIRPETNTYTDVISSPQRMPSHISRVPSPELT